MKKQTLLKVFVGILFLAFTTTTSCSKKSDVKKDDEENPGGGDGGDNGAAYLTGSDYYLIAMDETTKAKIASKVTADYRVDEANRFLYVWNETYIAGTPSGPNAFGQVDSWISLAVAPGMTWSGFGISPGGASTIDLSKVTPQHTLHFAMKSRGNATHMVGLGDGTNNFRLAIGTAPFVDGPNTFQPYKNFTRDGEWHHIEIPMSEFMGTGKLNFRTGGFSTDNLFSVLSGGVAGTTLDIDGVFIYKKK